MGGASIIGTIAMGAEVAMVGTLCSSLAVVEEIRTLPTAFKRLIVLDDKASVVWTESGSLFRAFNAV